MKTHIELLGWIQIVSGVLGVIVGAAVMVLLFVLAPVSGDETAYWTLIIVGAVGGGLVLLVSIPQVVAGIGLLRTKPWARALTLILSILALFAFPIGTIVAVYSFWVLTQAESARLLGAPA